MCVVVTWSPLAHPPRRREPVKGDIMGHEPRSYGRNFAQTKCVWCGKLMSGTDCIPDAVKVWIARYAKDHGSHWRSKLIRLLDSESDDPGLWTLRNCLSPRTLLKLPTDSVMLVALRDESPSEG